MKRRELERHLREHGCVLLRHGAKHDAWINTASGAQSAVPRHGELKKGIARAICRQRGVPDPTGL